MAGHTLALPDSQISELLAKHPWPGGHRSARRLEWLWTFDIDAPRDDVWKMISDMSRLNHALRNPEMQFVERGGNRYGRARYGGITHEWHEVPWNWVAGQWYSLVRDYSRGAMKTLYSVHTFADLPGDRTRLTVYFGIEPSSALWSPALRISFSAMGRAYRRLAPLLRRGSNGPSRPPVFDLPLPELRPEAAARLEAITADLHSQRIDKTLVAKLIQFVRQGDEIELGRIQLRVCAREWNVNEQDLVRAALFATRAGMFELMWDVLCPHCRGVRDSASELSAVTTSGNCEVCAVEFPTSDAVEITFRVHPSLRTFEPRTYCSAEPARKPHIILQRTVPPGEVIEVRPELRNGTYRLRRKGNDRLNGLLDIANEESEQPIIWKATQPVGEHRCAPIPTISLFNDDSTPAQFIVEEASPTDLALKPARLLAHPDFRDLFSEQYLASDVALSVGEQTILFTDIVGSTAMYIAGGDPGAFVTVRQHFNKVFAIVATWRGAVIKTIGDAVMAAFIDPLDGVRAAEEIQRAFSGDEALRLRVSLNTGPCIAVRLNANLDFFGNTVNLAAKLQAVAEAGQVGLSQETLGSAGVRDFVEEHGLALESVSLPVKGLRNPVEAWRWDVWKD